MKGQGQTYSVVSLFFFSHYQLTYTENFIVISPIISKKFLKNVKTSQRTVNLIDLAHENIV